MNLLELKLLVYKKRNWQYNFIKLSELPEKFETDKTIRVSIHEKESIINISSTSETQLSSAMNTVADVIGKVNFSVIQPYLLNSRFEVGLITMQNTIFSVEAKNVITSDISTEINSNWSNRILGYSCQKIDSSIRGWLDVAKVVPLNTTSDSYYVDATGVLDKATIAKLSDYSPLTLKKMSTDYARWFSSDKLDYFEYSMY